MDNKLNDKTKQELATITQDLKKQGLSAGDKYVPDTNAKEQPDDANLRSREIAKEKPIKGMEQKYQPTMPPPPPKGKSKGRSL